MGNARARAQSIETPCSCDADRSYRPLAGQRAWPARHLVRRPAILASESAHWRIATAELEIREMLRAAWLRPPLKPSFAERLLGSLQPLDRQRRPVRLYPWKTVRCLTAQVRGADRG